MIPGQLISLITFPGVLVHEIAHKFFCDLAGITVYEVSYFNLSKTPGYVIHGPARTLKSSFLISIGPLIVNSLLCVILTFSSVIPIFIIGIQNAHITAYILMWAGVTIGMHAFPSAQDAQSFKELVKQSKGNFLLKTFAWFFVFLTSLAAALSFFWFDFFYAIALSYLLPALCGIV